MTGLASIARRTLALGALLLLGGVVPAGEIQFADSADEVPDFATDTEKKDVEADYNPSARCPALGDENLTKEEEVDAFLACMQNGLQQSGYSVSSYRDQRAVLQIRPDDFPASDVEHLRVKEDDADIQSVLLHSRHPGLVGRFHDFIQNPAGGAGHAVYIKINSAIEEIQIPTTGMRRAREVNQAVLAALLDTDYYVTYRASYFQVATDKHGTGIHFIGVRSDDPNLISSEVYLEPMPFIVQERQGEGATGGAGGAARGPSPQP